MKLWETYFRLWDRVRHDLTEGVRTERRLESIWEEERGNSYYGYLCDKGTCLESGV